MREDAHQPVWFAFGGSVLRQTEGVGGGGAETETEEGDGREESLWG